MWTVVFIAFLISDCARSSNVDQSSSKLSTVGSFQVTDMSKGLDSKIYSSRSTNLDDLSNPKSTFVTKSKGSSSLSKSPVASVSFRTSSSLDRVSSKGDDSSKFSDKPTKLTTSRLPSKDVTAFSQPRSYKRPFNRTKIFNPPSKYVSFDQAKASVHQEESFFDEPDDNFVLISDSSRPLTSFGYPTDDEPALGPAPEPPTQRRYKIKRRKYRRNMTSSAAPDDATTYPQDYETSPKHSFTNEKDAKFLNLFTIIQFPNEVCNEEGGTCYHELECAGLGGVPSTRCARGFGVCCMIEATCGARTNINNTVFVGSEATMGSCSLSIDKVPCTRQIRLDFLQFELEAPRDGECLKDRLFISGANRNVNVPVLCGSLTGQHIYLDVDEVPGPVILNLISAKPIFRIKITQVCNNHPMLAPKSCLQYYTGKTGVIRSFNYAPASMSSSYLNNLNYAVCIGKEPDSCSITYSNESPEGMEYEFDIVNLDEDGQLSVPPRQAGAEVFNCPDDYISISNVRLCGQKLNDGSVQVDFTKNYPVTDSTRGPFSISVRTDDSTVGKGFYLNFEQKAC